VGRKGHQRHDDGRDRDGGRDRKIDAAADHHQRLADPDQADHRGKLHQVAEMPELGEAWQRDSRSKPEQRHDEIGQGAARGIIAHEGTKRRHAIRRSICRKRGKATVTTMINPCTTYCATGGILRKNITLISTLISRLPARAPRNVPCPPRKLTPPSTAAAIAASVNGPPMTGSPDPVCAAT